MSDKYKTVHGNGIVCEPISDYCKCNESRFKQLHIFNDTHAVTGKSDIRVIELFAGVGGFRIGLERASDRFKTVWSNQWEPTTKRQDASIIYCNRFGACGHSNADISTVPATDIPEADLLVGGFPCQDYSVATTLKNACGIEGKKGVLWWQIYRILHDSKKRPTYLFLENVDRLLKSPASQRGRDFAIILASLSDLGYVVEWRVINAADYGMPQRRRRTYIVAYLKQTYLAERAAKATGEPFDTVLKAGVIARSFSAKEDSSNTRKGRNIFKIKGSLDYISRHFNEDGKQNKTSPFRNAGIMINRQVFTTELTSEYSGPCITLGQLLVDEKDVPEEYFISDKELPKWTYLKGGKSEKRINASGFEYRYSEGSMTFPDATDKPSRTIITGEGGTSPSRFKHVVVTKSGRYRRLMPVELERLNMFPDGHTHEATDTRRAFLMGNALVTGIVERIGQVLSKYIGLYE